MEVAGVGDGHRQEFSRVLLHTYIYTTLELIISRYHIDLWKLKVPIKVRIFIWLMLEDKLLTQYVLLYRGCIVQSGCHLYSENLVETKDHIMWDCAYAKRFWIGLMAQYNILIQRGPDIATVWSKGKSQLPKTANWDRIWAGGAWTLWRERNRRLFSGETETSASADHTYNEGDREQ